MRQVLSIRKPTDILSHINSLPLQLPTPPTPATPLNHRPTALAAIRAIERTAMTQQIPQPGLLELMTYLERREIRKGLCTRNFLGPVEHLCEKFMTGVKFGPVITRETEGVRPKPSPEGVWRCAEVWYEEEDVERDGQKRQEISIEGQLGNDPSSSSVQLANPHPQPHHLEFASRLIMVGDSLDDVAAGHRAGAATILLASEETEEELLRVHEFVDRVVWRLDEIVGILEEGFEGVEGED